MMGEDRLRELLRDPGWSLPVWPDAQARVRRAARRQRLTIASVGAAVTAVVTMAAAVPAAVLGGIGAGPAAAPGGGGPGGGQSAAIARHGGVIQAVAIPAVGAAGFPARFYPAASPARINIAALPRCPARAGLRAPARNAATAALTVLRGLGQNFSTDLHSSDRAFWPKITSDWRQVTVPAMSAHVFTAAVPSVVTVDWPVLYSGPLKFSRQAAGRWSPAGPQESLAPPKPAAVRRITVLQRIVTAGCGANLVRHSWVVVSGHAASPAREAETLFLNRRGRLLIYNSE